MTRRDVALAYFDGFSRSDHASILACLTDNVIWDLPGYAHLEGKAAFDAEIENPAFEGSPVLIVDRFVEDGDTIVAIGEGAGSQVGGGAFRFAFCTVLTFDGELVRRVESFVAPLPS